MVGGPVPEIVFLQVKVHYLSAVQRNVLRDKRGGRSLRVLLALPPLPGEDHGVGGKTLSHVGNQRNCVVAQLCSVVHGHQ